MQVIDRLVKIMEIKGITAYQLEKDIGINQTTFYNWKKGKQPPADKLHKIITYLEVTPNELFGYDPVITFTENEKEMIKLFQQLPEREQIKYIARLEDAVEKFTMQNE